jgi:hypothetical protein
MKILRFTTIGVLVAVLGTAFPSPGDEASALELAPIRPITPIPTNPVFPIVAIRYFGPEREICAATSGALNARPACRPSERTLDPTAVRICAAASGVVSLTGPRCRAGTSEVDLRSIRDSSPPTWFGAGSAPPPFRPITPIRPLPPIRPIFPIDEPAPFPFPTAKVLCKRGTRVALRQSCLANETTVHPSALVACMTRAGTVSVQAGACDARETRLDLRAVRGPGDNPVGIGPLVGLVPSLADLVAEYR